ncbi:serine/threonineeeee-protein kinase ATR [Sporothrix schenckii 1099-18]|uniref:non-specific serine/threonine protein kinase n=1 Tax=Sporothrix schenckii 1099-18 TaxID=1397361 RepID=A0A0F2LZ12_SPOSC|nr:serine/threonineeeee-protein kinase ATR [Sporothrix schenckii 1099-18]KJR82707.1 serine/threonineeeee-protein kinase ATR [Sporothrix schenckii 1099-18]
MSIPPENASLRPDAEGEPAPAPMESQIPNNNYSVDDDGTENQERESKRRKTEPSAPVPILTNIRNRICAKFGVEMGDNVRETLSTMCEAIQSREDLQDEQTICSALEFLSQTLCAIDHTATLADPHDNSSPIMCKPCKTFDTTYTPSRHKEKERGDAACAFQLFLNIITTLVPTTGPLTVRALILLRRIVLHANTDDILDYEQSDLCKWCSAQLYSPDKAVRDQAAKSVSVFVRDRTDASMCVMEKNRRRFYSGLDHMLASGDCIMQETSSLTWMYMAMAVAENQLRPMLCGLLAHLDSEHMPVWNMAILEIRHLASHFGRTPNEIFEPYWRKTAHLIVKHIADRPDVASAIANLFGTTAPKLALHLQSQAIPSLLFNHQTAAIRKISEYRGDGDELWLTFMDKSNLTSILAMWVRLPAEFGALDDLMERFQTFSPQLGLATIRDVMGAAAVPVLAELFIHLTYESTPSSVRFPSIVEGIGFKPILTIARLLNTNTSLQADDEIVIGFLSQHVLGFTTRLSDVRVYDGKRHLCHWVNGIEALEILIKYLRSEIRVARPQVIAFLLDALGDHPGYAACWQASVRRAAISCWAALVQNVGEENVHTLVETTFCVIRKNWSQFGDWEKEKCQDLLQWLLAKPNGRHRDCIVEKIDVLPRLNIPELQRAVDNKTDKLRKPLGGMQTIDLFAQRITHENLDVVWVALEDAKEFLQHNQDSLQAPTQGEKSDSAVAHFVRALLDCSAKYNVSEPALASACMACIGFIGCLDANRLGAVAKDPPFVVIYNFSNLEESIDFVIYMLQHVLTRAFLSATNSTSQGLIAYAVQTLLTKCGINNAIFSQGRELKSTYEKWKALPELVQVVLSPLLVSKYHIALPARVLIRYPIFWPGRTYGDWLRTFVVDLLAKPQTQFAEILHESLSRTARGNDLAVAEFLLPYMVVHVVTGLRSTDEDREQITLELQHISQYQPPDEAPSADREQAKLFYDAVFRVIEYALVWLRSSIHHEKPTGVAHMEKFIGAFPAEVLSQKALYCKDYARAMFFLEPVAMATVPEEDAEETARRDKAESDMIDIYAQIDDPDYLGGMMSKAGSIVEMNTYRKALLEQKAGRWESATTWHLSDLSSEPDNVDIQARVLKCFLEAGHHDALLARVDGMNLSEAPAGTVSKVLPLALEASWATFQWDKLGTMVPIYKGDTFDIFNVGVASALSHLQQLNMTEFDSALNKIVDRIAASMSYSTTTSLQACHEAMFRAHVVTDLRLISSVTKAEADVMERRSSAQGPKKTSAALATLIQRLDLLEDVSDKRYLLALQRAAMESLRPIYGDKEISTLWLLSARLARKTGSNGECLKAIAHARQLGDPAAEVENARRQWAWGGKHQAIADLRLAISRGLPSNEGDSGGSGVASEPGTGSFGQKWSIHEAAPLAARAGLLLTRWLDASGETSRPVLRESYKELSSKYNEWEKSHYFLGRHYKKVLESEQALKPDEQSDSFLMGELARLEIESYLRAARLGTKYLHTTLPRFLTVWLGLGSQIHKAPDGKAAVAEDLVQRRTEVLMGLHRRLLRQVQRLPPFIFYTALPQLVARINHPNREVCFVLDQIITKVVQAYPQQASWSVFGVMTTRPKDHPIKKPAARLIKALTAQPGATASLKHILRAGITLADDLVKVGRKGNYRANSATKAASLQRDMNFRMNDPIDLVVPIARCLTATMPGRIADSSTAGGASGVSSPAVVATANSTGEVSNSATAMALLTHNAFSSDVITIHAFMDEVLILGSLAQPRKLTIRGSDGRLYDIMLKPKDDMRTDQRIMEVNAQINQALRKDTEATRRQLSIRTYAVTPLNEDCGIIEWVLGLKTLREILRPYYDLRRSQVQPRPPEPLEIQKMLTDAGTPRQRVHVFTATVLPAFPPVLQEWFMRRFPYPAVWFTARLQFTRSAAVMSMAGAVLGLGDRHCENVLVDQDSGGVMHVDFNCLFEKGKLFTQPETVPFRLTQNMRAAMGICDDRGPFRRSCELTLQMMREQEETLLAVLEAFIHDPTLDLQADPRGGHQHHAAARAKPPPVVKLDPQSVVKNIKRRINGLLLEETIPLGVEGQARELIKQATEATNLSAMYIGWAPHW